MAGIIVGWAGTISSIPSGWVLCDGNNGTPNILNKFIKAPANGADSGATGGSSTHTHGSSSHNHTQDSHSHSSTSGVDIGTRGGTYRGSGSDLASSDHTHSLTIDASTATNQATTVTSDATSSNPPYYKLAFIYNALGYRFPVGSIIKWNIATLPVGWIACNSSPDLRNKFILSVGSSEDPGSTGGSSDSHTHTSSHTHTQDSHTHTGSHGSSSSCTKGGYDAGYDHGTYALCAHTHAITPVATTATNQASDANISSGDGQPAYYKLLDIKNNVSLNRPRYGIVNWSGAIATIPTGYTICDGTNGSPDLRGKFIKGALDSSELGNTGGSATHTHSATSHNHTQNSHSHTITIGAETVWGWIQEYGSVVTAVYHTHSGSVSGTATNQAATLSVSSANGEPPYYELLFIMQTITMDVGAYAFILS